MRFDERKFRGGRRAAHAGVAAGAVAVALLAGAGLAGAPAVAADATAQKPATSQDAPKYGPRGGRAHGGPGMGGGPTMMVPGMMHPGMFERMADELGLTTEQRQKIRGYFDAARPGMQELAAKQRANAQQLMDAKPDDPKYASIVQKASQEAGALTTQMVQQASQVRAQVYGVLTPEQRTKLAAQQAEMHERMQARRHDRMGRRGGPGGPGGPPEAPNGPPPPPEN
jgi:Spy/CpxP family protein refolding chaperone